MICTRIGRSGSFHAAAIIRTSRIRRFARTVARLRGAIPASRSVDAIFKHHISEDPVVGQWLVFEIDKPALDVRGEESDRDSVADVKAGSAADKSAFCGWIEYPHPGALG